jgi:hyaluronan synthase
MDSRIPSAWPRSKAKLAIVPLILLIGVLVAGRHLYQNYLAVTGGGHEFAFLWTLTFLPLVWHVALSWFERPFTVTQEQAEQLARLRVTLNVPVFNEDETALRTALQSVLNQTRPVDRVQVVNDGSTENVEQLMAVRAWWLAQADGYPATRLEWIDLPNAGKRRAQVTTFRDDDADVFATMDSDTVLDSRCVAEGLKPFARPDITSVASVILAYNNRTLWVRVTDTWLLAFQLTVRGAMSKLGCVLVNNGNFALYRAEVVRKAIPCYEGEQFLGHPVEFSDDSLLTLFGSPRRWVVKGARRGSSEQGFRG